MLVVSNRSRYVSPIQPTCNISFHSFQGELARIMVKFYWLRQWVQKLMSEMSRANAATSNWKCNLLRSVGVKHIAFSFNQRTSFTFRCISVVIFISKASNNMQILQTVHDIVGYQVSDLIS